MTFFDFILKASVTLTAIGHWAAFLLGAGVALMLVGLVAVVRSVRRADRRIDQILASEDGLLDMPYAVGVVRVPGSES